MIIDSSQQCMSPLMLAPLKGLLSPAPKPVCTEAGVADYKSPTRDLWGETFTVLEDMVEEMSYLDKSSQERFPVSYTHLTLPTILLV